jgi:hypothetical protein
LCSIKSWTQTLQDGDALAVAINLEIAASAALHGTAAKVRGVISYVRFYALLDDYVGTNSLRLAEQSTIEVGQAVVEGHVSLTFPGVEHVAVASDLLAVAGEGVVGATASETPLGLANNDIHNDEKERDNSGKLHLECIRCGLGGFV